MKISLVIPAFNEERLLDATLRQVKCALAVFTRRGWETELIVCDNNSTDHTADIAKTHGVRVVFEPVNQIARARNTGASVATGDWLVFVDADSLPSPELFAEVADQMVSGECLAGGCTVKLDGHYVFANLVVWLWNGLSRSAKLLAGSFIFCEAETFRAMGGFSLERFAGEEIELSLRLKSLARQRGRRVVVLHRYPLLTSARKAHLYTPAEHTWFLFRTVLTGGRALRRREECSTWYDGRR